MVKASPPLAPAEISVCEIQPDYLERRKASSPKTGEDRRNDIAIPDAASHRFGTMAALSALMRAI
jgi:hypothetical protein